MKKILKYISASLLIGLFISNSAFAFSDISASDRDIEAINYVEQLDIFEGENFDPSKVVTKGEFAKWILGVSDADEAIDKLRDLGIVSYWAENSDFDADREISVRKALEFYTKLYGIPVPKLFNEDVFLDTVDNVGVDAFYAPLINAALKANLIRVSNKKVFVNKFLTRRDFAYMIYNGSKFQNKFEEATGETGGKVIITTINRDSLSQEEKYEILADVWRRINERYYEKDGINEDELIYGAIEGLVESLGDPYTNFSPPTESSVINSLSNEVEGIGASLIMNDDEQVEIVAPIKNSPAEKAGLLPGDIIESVDGSSVQGLKLKEVVAKITGKSGTRVRIGIRRDGVLKEYTIVRAKVNFEPVILELTSDNVAIITITNFGAGVAESFDKVVDAVKDKDLKGIILDVRSNPGGYLNASTQIADHFVTSGKVIVKTKDSDGNVRATTAKNGGAFEGLPAIVLIDGGSASASEIVAAALDESASAILVGEKTYGKGTVQEVISYKDGSSFKVTIAHWLSPFGSDLNKKGVQPDYTVIRTDADRAASNDPVMNRALQLVR